MQKRTPDYDNVFKTMKMKHKRLFVSVINDIFHRDYPKDVRVEVLPSEGYFTENETGELSDGEMIDLMGFVNTIVTHITNGNKNEERLVNIMGGTIIETESERVIKQSKA